MIKIEAGDTVICIDDSKVHNLVLGETYIILASFSNRDGIYVKVDNGTWSWYHSKRFVLKR